MKEPEYKPDDYVAAFRHIVVAPHQIRMLQAHYHAPNRTLTATQMANALGYSTALRRVGASLSLRRRTGSKPLM